MNVTMVALKLRNICYVECADFSSQLVPQDPSDEPASELLARIRAERAAQQAVKKPRGRKAKEAA